MKKHWIAILAPILACGLGFWASHVSDKTHDLPGAGEIVAISVIGFFILWVMLDKK